MRKIAFAVLGLSLCAGTFAFAGAANTNLNVSASVSNNCTISTTALDFGPYDPIVAQASSDLTGTGTVTITCTKGATTTVGLGLGSNATGSTRRMTDGSSNYLTYEAYQPPNSTPGTACSYSSPTVWGTSGSNLFTPAAAPNKNARTYNVCGSLFAAQDVPAGSYTDTVVATVNF